MAYDFDTLGSRILNAARMAAAMHLYQANGPTTSQPGQQVTIGRAGPRVGDDGSRQRHTDLPKDGPLPAHADGGDR